MSPSATYTTFIVTSVALVAMASPSPLASTHKAPVPPTPPTSTSTTTSTTGCPAATTTVTTAAALTSALKAAKAGTHIQLQPGTYKGKFVLSSSGTAAAPIYVCGPTSAILDAGSTKSGYVFQVKDASYVHLVGFTATDGQKGVVTDTVPHSEITGLTVTKIGDEAIHLRTNSTYDVVSNNIVSNTGQHSGKYGEGIYVGSAKSNWCTYTDCNPDRSDNDQVLNNHISATTAESVDIKEGTTGGVLSGNTFDGAKTTSADSWVDVKGNNWTISANTGTTSTKDGFQTHQILSGWGQNNTFSANQANVNGPGYGFDLTPVAGNVVACNNKQVGAKKGLANVACK